MKNSSVEIIYKLANGKRVCLEVSIDVKELLQKADSQVRSQRRQDRRYLDFTGSINELEDCYIPPQEDFADTLSRIDNYRNLSAAIHKLPELQRRRLYLYFFEGLTYRQIAAREGVGFTTVARSVERAVEALKRLIKK